MGEKIKATRKVKLKKEIDMPESVEVSLDGQVLTLKGPQGEVKRKIKKQNVSIKIDGSKISLESDKSTKKDKKLLGSLEAHIKNMIKGVLQTHTYILKICSGHFPMSVSVVENKLHVKNFLGEKVPRILKLKEGTIVKVDGGSINVTSTSKELAGQVSADIEQLTRRPGYDTRVFQDGIYIINKAGKDLK